jgi:hypothetical protein
MGFEFDPARRTELTDPYRRAELEHLWLSEDPTGRRQPPDRLTGQDLAAYRQWEAAKISELDTARSQVAKEFGRLRSLGLGPGRAGSGSEPKIADSTAATTYSKLTTLARDADPQKRALSTDALPAARDAARRNPRDLPDVLQTFRCSVDSALAGTAFKGGYDKVSSALDAYVQAANQSLAEWTRLVTSAAEPNAPDLNARAERCRIDLSRVCMWIDDLAAASNVSADKLPPMATDGLLMYVGAVGEEVATQYAARTADPSFGLMFARTSELPQREPIDRTAPAFKDSLAAQFEAKPTTALYELGKAYDRLLGLNLKAAERTASVAALQAFDFKETGKAWDSWIKQLSKVPGQDMVKLKSQLNLIAFRLETLRKAIVAAFASSPDLNLATKVPIDGFIALIQGQTEMASNLLRR